MDCGEKNSRAAAVLPGRDTADPSQDTMAQRMDEFDITHDDLAQILAENKTPVKQRPRKRPGTDNSSDGSDANPASTLLFANPLVSPATSQEICAFVEAATRGGMGGLGLAKEENGGKEQLEMENEAGANNGRTMKLAVDPTLLGALDVTLRHHNAAHPLLTLREMVRLASCSKSISDMVAEAPLWRKLFDRAVQSGRPYGPRTGRAAALARSYKASTVCGENRLLSCFAHPTDAVIAAVGWKKATSCLLSKTCTNCGALAALANPITFTRTCRLCALVDSSAYLINKTNAKLFLLSDKDLSKLRSATYENRHPASKKECSSTLYLLSEVMAASYKKYTNAEGLAAEIGRRRTAALERYERSQTTSKPQKKRPRMERLSDRPGDDVRRVMFAEGGLPIGTCEDVESCAMERSVHCRYCSAMGSVEDIVVHEKLVHCKLGAF